MSTRKKSNVYTPPPQSFPGQMPLDEPSVPTGEPSKFKGVDVHELDQKINRQLLDFSGLLNNLSSVEEKQKALWKQIYENAVQDRNNAYIMWADLYVFVSTNPTEHAIHGQNLSRYMERMSKANDQILKLAEMVSSASQEQIDETMTEDEMYAHIQKTAQDGH